MLRSDLIVALEAERLAVDTVLLNSLHHHGPATVPELAYRLALETAVVRQALRALQSRGSVSVDPCDRWRLRP